MKDQNLAGKVLLIFLPVLTHQFTCVIGNVFGCFNELLLFLSQSKYPWFSSLFWDMRTEIAAGVPLTLIHTLYRAIFNR